MPGSERGTGPRARRAGLLAGLALLALAMLVPPPSGLSLDGWRTLALALCMAIWWSTEPVPIGVTALLPPVLLPLTTGAPLSAITAPYANPLVFLFLGGFLLAAAVERHGLHRRLAWHVLQLAGTEPRRLVLGVMLVSALLSMWISNTAAVLLLLPVVLSVLRAEDAAPGLAVALLLGLAYGASIGGTGTLIGTPPNALLAGWLSEARGLDLSFAHWAMLGMPFVALFLPLAWWLLARGLGRGGADGADAALAQLRPGPPARPEARVAVLFALAAGLWMTRPLLNALPGLGALSDEGIALGIGIALFLVPAGRIGEGRALLTWDEARNIPWQVLLLFGGGLSLAAAMDRSGLALWVGQGLAGLGALPAIAVLAALALTVVLLTELVSNTAVVAALLPVVGTIAEGTGLMPETLGAALALSASCSFMLPAATPPNALVFASGQVTVARMMRAGAGMNLVSVILVTLVTTLLAPLLF